MSSRQEYHRGICYNPSIPASFDGTDNLYQYVQRDGKFNLSRNQIQKWLHRREPYSLQKAVRYFFERTPIVVAGIESMVFRLDGYEKIF